ncbi:MAG: UDP-N-acetylmuramoyl-L-alanine--D-glutamate ligase [Bacteroidales bacterium]
MNLKLVILGAGESGIGSAILAKSKGWDVLVSDSGIIPEERVSELNSLSIPYEMQGHSKLVFENVAMVIKSPGIPDDIPLIKKFEDCDIPVISEIEFASRYSKGKLIGISGSNGKTTTSLLLYHILKNSGYDVALVGNIGYSFARALAERDYDYYVIELSSFQLDRMYDAVLHIAILLNITPDHLDRYKYSIGNYSRSKFRLTRNQTAGDYFIYCKDDHLTQEYMSCKVGEAKCIPFSICEKLNYGASLKGQYLNINLTQKNFKMTIDELAIIGKHNVYNSMAAGIAAKLIDVRNENLRDCLSDFQNDPHRLEEVSVIQDVTFINDSKATNVNSVWFALESVPGRVIWLVGGVDKGNDYSELFDLVQKKVKTIICIGEDNEKLLAEFKNFVSEIYCENDMDKAVKLAKSVASENDTVLLSPACASFDCYSNYEERGDEFKKAVNNLDGNV